MQWLGDHSVQLLFLGGYLMLLAYHGWIGNKRSSTLDHYLIGGRSLGGIAIGLSFYATFVSSVTFVGHAGRGYTQGPSWWMVCVVVFGGLSFVAWFGVAPRLVTAARHYQVLTIPQLIGARYDSRFLRRLAGFVVVISSVFYMVAVYYGATWVLESLLDLEDVRLFGVAHLPVVGAVFLVVTAYTLAGGFHSVVATDAVQGSILLVASLLMPAALVYQHGGLEPLLDAARAAEPHALDWNRDVPLATMIGLALGVGVKTLVEPRLLSRFYGLSSNAELRRGRWIAPIFMLTTYLTLLPVGFLSHAVIKPDYLIGFDGKIDTDRVIPFLLGPYNLLGVAGGAFFLTGLIAAVMSSIDSVLLVAASSADHDWIKPGREAETTMRYTRRWVVVLSAAAATISVIAQEGIIEMSAFSGSIYAACFLPSLIVGLFWRRPTRLAAEVSMAVAVLVTPTWFIAKRSLAPWLHELYVSVAISMSLFIGITLFATANRLSRQSAE